MFEGGIEEMKDVVSLNAEAADNFISTTKAVQEALNAARRNLSSTMSVLGMSISGAEDHAKLREVMARYNVQASLVGALFGRDNMLAGLYQDIPSGFSYAMDRLKVQAKSYDFNQTADIIDFVNANAQLFIDLGILTKEQYLEVVATGLWEAGDKIGDEIGTGLTKAKMQTILNTTMYEIADQYVMFVERYLYFMREVGAIAQGGITSMDLPEAIERLKGVWDNLTYWIENDIIALADMSNWKAVMESGLDITSILRVLAVSINENFLNLLATPSAYKSGYVNIFDQINKVAPSREIMLMRFLDAMTSMSGTEKGSVALTGLEIINYAESRAALEKALIKDKTFKTFVDAGVTALGAVQVAIRDELIKNIVDLGKGAIAQYIPGGVKIFDAMLDIPIIGGALNILTGITAKFIGNYLYSLIEDKTAEWLLFLTASLDVVNVGVSGESILEKEELITLAQSIIVDGAKFVGNLLKLPFEIFSGKTTLENFLGGLTFEALLPSTIAFINKLGEESKTVVSGMVMTGLKNIEILKPLNNLLTAYEAMDEKTHEEAVKLVESQWDALKTFTADLLGVNEWIINLLDIGLFRGGIVDLVAGLLPILSKPPEQIITEDTKNQSKLMEFGGTISLTSFTQTTEGEKLARTLNDFTREADLLILAAVADRIDNMVPLSLAEIKNTVSSVMSTREGYTDAIRTAGLQQITNDAVRTQVTELYKLMTSYTIDVDGVAMSLLTLYNGFMSGILGPSGDILSDAILGASTTKEAREQIITRFKTLALGIDPQEYSQLESFLNTFYTTMLPALTPADIGRLFPATAIPLEYINKAGGWASIDAQQKFLSTMSDEDMTKALEYLDAKTQALNESFQTAGTVFANLGTTLQTGTDELGWGVDILAKSMKTVGVVASSLGTMQQGSEAIKYWGGEFANLQATDGILKSVQTLLGLAGGWGQLIGGLLQGVVSIAQIWKESHKITESQLIAIRQNTVAIESLTNILDSMRLTMYGAPSGFIYGYTNPSPVMTDEFGPTNTRSVMFNIEALNISGSGDPDEIAAAVEQGIVMAAKRIR